MVTWMRSLAVRWADDDPDRASAYARLALMGSCPSDEAAAEKLMSDTQAAVKDFNISGTPTFLLNGKVVEGTNWPMVETKLKEAGAR